MSLGWIQVRNRLKFFFGIHLIFYSSLLCAQDEELIEWTRNATRSDFERNSTSTPYRLNLNEALARATQDRLSFHEFPGLITTLAASADSSQQALSVDVLANLLLIKKTETQQNIGSAFASYFGSFGTEIGRQEDPRFHELVRVWRRYSAVDVAMAKICAGTMCAPGAPKEHAGAVRETFRIMSPFVLNGPAFISNLDAWDRMLSTPQRKSGLIALAKHVALRVESAMQGLGTEGNIYADAVNVMASRGMSLEEAHEAAMDVLGAYSTRGADVTRLYYAAWPGSRIGNQLGALSTHSAMLMTVATMVGVTAFATVNHLVYGNVTSMNAEAVGASAVPTMAGAEVLVSGDYQGVPAGQDAFISAKYRPFLDALAFLGTAIPYLDGVAHRRGESYSLPAEVRSRASYVRPYHFWLSAYLAKELLVQGYSPAAAIEAVHRIGLVYELKASVGTVSANLLGVDPAYTLETQKDLVFNAAGAVYGVAKHMKRPLDLDVDPVLAVWKRHADSPPSQPRYSRISDAFYVAPSFLQPLVEKAIGGHRLLAQINALEPFVPYEVWNAQLAALTGPNGVLAFPGPCATLAHQ